MLGSLDGLAPVRRFWLDQQDHANNDLDQFELVCSVREQVLAPRVAVLSQGEGLCALLACRLERTPFSPTVGYFAPVSINARTVAVLHRGILGTIDAHGAGLLVSALDDILRHGEADAIDFHFVQEGTPLFDALVAHRASWRRRVLPRWSMHHEMSLGPSGNFMTDKLRAKHRSWLRKKQKMLESDFAGRINWRWLTQIDDIGALCRVLESVAQHTYQRGLGTGFFNDRDFQERLALFAKRGILRVTLLEIDGRARAFWFGTIHRGVFHSSETGYDPALRQYEVGTLMFVRMADALANESVQRLDFGIGDALYKARFADRSWRETGVWLFAPTLKGLLMRSVLEVVLTVDVAARALLRQTGVLGRLKAVWRRLKTRTAAATQTDSTAPDAARRQELFLP